MKTLLVLFLGFSSSFMLSACASHRMRGDEAPLVSGPKIADLKITAAIESALSIKPYVLISLYLRNLGENWLRVKSVSILDVEGADQFNVVLGPDLNSWRKSVALDFDLRLDTTKKAPERAKLRLEKAKLSEYGDEDHLYQTFSLPPQLQTRKWLLFHFPGKTTPQSFKLEITWIDDQKQIFEARLSP